MRSVSLMLCPVPKPLGAPLHLISGSATVADRAVLKHWPRLANCHSGSATMADQAVLKHVSEDTVPEIVQQPWQIERFSNLWVWICCLIWAFLFQRTAKSARSSCFCDPPGRFLDRALGSPQAYIPALTAVWIHYSRTILGMFFISHSTLAAFSLTVSKIDRLKP